MHSLLWKYSTFAGHRLFEHLLYLSVYMCELGMYKSLWTSICIIFLLKERLRKREGDGRRGTMTVWMKYIHMQIFRYHHISCSQKLHYVIHYKNASLPTVTWPEVLVSLQRRGPSVYHTGEFLLPTEEGFRCRGMTYPLFSEIEDFSPPPVMQPPAASDYERDSRGVSRSSRSWNQKYFIFKKLWMIISLKWHS